MLCDGKLHAPLTIKYFYTRLDSLSIKEDITCQDVIHSLVSSAASLSKVAYVTQQKSL